MCKAKAAGKCQPLGVRGYTPRGNVTANPTHHAEAPGVEGRTPRGKDAANPTHMPCYTDATPQVIVVSPLSLYFLKGQLADRPVRILVNSGSALTLVQTDLWQHLDVLTPPLAEG